MDKISLTGGNHDGEEVDATQTTARSSSELKEYVAEDGERSLETSKQYGELPIFDFVGRVFIKHVVQGMGEV
jgi:hypothetical protein